MRRIRKAEETGAVELDLSRMKDGMVTELETLTRLPPELECLTSLQLHGDLSPLATPGTDASVCLVLGAIRCVAPIPMLDERIQDPFLEGRYAFHAMI